jgi:hypothetical protein
MLGCLFDHQWSWPRRRGRKDVQVCSRCGAERESKVRFGGPRYRRTQDAIPGFAAAPLTAEMRGVEEELGHLGSLAA